ncbi:MAG: ATP-binding protein [Candidatus Hermodarchaeota archaeon]
MMKSEKEYYSIFNLIPEYIYVVDVDGNFCEANQATLNLLGISLEDLGKKNLKDFTKVEDLDELLNAFKDLKRGQEIRGKEVQVIMPSGELLDLEINSVPIKEKEKVIKILNSAREITERKKIERALKESEIKYQKAYSRSNIYKDLLAHDISNILQNIQMSCEFIAKNINDPQKFAKIEELNEVVKNQIFRGKIIVSNIRKLSKLEEKEPILTRYNVHKVLENAIKFVINSFQERDIELQVNFERKEYYVMANEFLRDVFENVLFNAIKHNLKSEIEIIINLSNEKHDENSYIKIEFIDNARGIPEEAKKLIFQRTKNLKSGKGMGLGLSLVKTVMDSYNGKIWVKNKVKNDYTQGSNFVLLIPELI